MKPFTEAISKITDRLEAMQDRLEKAARRGPRIKGDGDGDGIPYEGRNRGKKPQAEATPGAHLLPKPPTFLTSNTAVKTENEGHAKALHALASKGDLKGLQGYSGFSPNSSKLASYKQALIQSLTNMLGKPKEPPKVEPKPAPKADAPDFGAAKLKEGVNAATHNKKVDAIASAYGKGDVNGILGLKFGINTYGKQQVALANKALAALGSTEKVTAGQDAGAHPALNGKTAPQPAAKPEPKPEPAPQTKPAAPTGAWVKVKTLADADAALAAYGVKLSKPKSKAWGKILAEKSVLEIVNAIGPEIQRLEGKFPGIHQGLTIMGAMPKGKANGVCWMNYGVIALKKPDSIKLAPEWKNAHGKPWVVARDEADKISGTFRHEMGHFIDGATNGKWRAEITGGHGAGPMFVSEAGQKSMSPAGGDNILTWMRKNVSEYGGTNTKEVMAELFCLYASKDYKPGTLPKFMESALENMARRKKQ